MIAANCNLYSIQVSSGLRKNSSSSLVSLHTLYNLHIMEDVEMRCLRRSDRIVLHEAQKVLQCKIKTEPKKVKAKKDGAKKMSVVTVKAVQPKKSKMKTQSRPKIESSKTVIKFLDIEQSKISDVFELIKKHSISDIDKNLKYAILKSVIKHVKQLNIANRIITLYNNAQRVAHMLPAYGNVCVNGTALSGHQIYEHMQEILGYPELWRLEEQTSSTHTPYKPLDLNDIVTMMQGFTVQSQVDDTFDMSSMLQSLSSHGV